MPKAPNFTKWTLLLAAVLPLVWNVSEASSGPGTEGASFLDIPVGAVPASLGSAYTARANDAYAPVCNPAGLGFLHSIGVSATHLSYVQALNYEYLGYVMPLGKQENTSSEDSEHTAGYRHGLGVSVQYLGSGNITSRDELGNITGNFSTTFAAYSLAYGRDLTDRWSVGLTGKAITESISDASGRAYAADIGTLYKVNDEITLGAVAANLGPSVKLVTESDSLPTVFRAGAYDEFLPDWDVSADVVYRETGLTSADAGLEWTYRNILELRGGFDSSHNNGLSVASALRAGVGLHLFGQDFSYAWAPYGDLGNAQYFSLDLHFGGGSTETQGKPHLKEVRNNRSSSSAEENPSSDSDYQNLNDLLSDSERKALPRHEGSKDQE